MDEIDCFRETMGYFATGVAVVTSLDPTGGPVGLTANSVTSVSLEPRLVLVCLSRESASLSVIQTAGRFGLSVLDRKDEVLARRFADELPGGRFEGLEPGTAPSGVPLLPRAIAWLDCTVWRTLEAGDHTVVFGEVEACGVAPAGDPLVFFRRRYGTFAP